VVNDFGRRGGAYCETDVEATDLETVIQDLLDGQYSNPVRVGSFNTAEGWSRGYFSQCRRGAASPVRSADARHPFQYPRFYRAA
jgi:hypothetical protein